MVYACISSGFKVQSAWLLPGAIFLAILVYTLYFALPFDNTYCQGGGSAQGLPLRYVWLVPSSRHLVVLAAFFCVGLSTGNMNRVMLSLCLSFLNLLYAWYQDRLIFVEEFSDYREYREQVPFLLPRLWKRR